MQSIRWGVSIAAIGLLPCALSCVNTSQVECAGLVCPAGMVCAAALDRCLEPDQQTSCSGKQEGEACTAETVPEGSCTEGFCIANLCGDDIVSATEECDGAELGGRDCTTLGFYQPAGLSCGGDCLFDTASCEQFCGDGIINGPELCDGFVDNQINCLGIGRDFGVPSCGSLCFPTFDSCRFIGFGRSLYPATGARDVWVENRSRAVLVGDDGLVLEYSGATDRWEPLDIGVVGGADLTAVWGSADSLFIAASDGSVYRGTADTWTRDMVAPGAVFTDIDGASPTAVTVVGDAGVAHAFDGTAWTAFDLAAFTDDWLQVQTVDGAVFVLSQDNVVRAAGGNVESYSMSMFQARGTSLLAFGADDAWVAARDSGLFFPDTLLFRWQGTNWQLTSNGPTGYQTQLAGASSDRLIAITTIGVDSYLWRLADGVWTDLYQPSNFDIVRMSAADDGTVIGVEAAGGLRRYDGMAWRSSREPPPETSPAGAEPPFTSVAVLSDSSAFATRDDVTSGDIQFFTRAVWRMVGNSWQNQTNAIQAAGGFNLGYRDVWAAGPEDVYAIGPGIMRFRESTGWEVELDTGSFQSIWGTSANNIYAVTRTEVWHFDGADWNMVDIGLQANHFMTQVTGSGPSDIYITMHSAGVGKMAHFNGSTWTLIDPGIPEIRSMWASGPDDLWVLTGEAGQIRHYNGTNWTVRQISQPIEGESVTGTGPDDVYVLSSEGASHFGGGRFAPIRTILGRDHQRVVADGQGVHFVGRGFDTLLRD